jgi:hypothetical protein
MKQRFLNQKLGKRISRKTNLQKAKLFADKAARSTRPGLPGRNFRAGKPT